MMNKEYGTYIKNQLSMTAKKVFATLSFCIKTIISIFIILQIICVAILFYWAKPVYVKLKNDRIEIKQKINISVNSKLPIKSYIDTIVNIPIKKNILLNLPLRTDLKVSIDEPFTVPVKEPINVYLDHDFKIKKNIDIVTSFVLDQHVETRLFGIDTNVPLKGIIPVDISIPINEDIKIKDSFSLTTTAPLICQVKHDFLIPLDLNAQATFVIDRTIPVALNTTLNTNLKLAGDLPCYLYLEIFYDRENKKLAFNHSIEVE